MLTERQYQIAALVATGASNKEIARELGISIRTVKNTLTAVFIKTGARSRTDLALQIVRGEQAAPNVFAHYIPNYLDQ